MELSSRHRYHGFRPFLRCKSKARFGLGVKSRQDQASEPLSPPFFLLFTRRASFQMNKSDNRALTSNSWQRWELGRYSSSLWPGLAVLGLGQREGMGREMP